MNIEQAAFAAEIMGGFGVILSLVYLTSELRRTTRQSQQDAMTLLTSKRGEMMQVIINNSELSTIFWRCLLGQRVPVHEWSRFSIYLHTTMVTIELGFKKIWAGEVDLVTSTSWKEGTDWWLKYPGMRTWWNTGQVGLSAQFKEYINQRLENIEVESSDAEQVVVSLAKTG